MRYVKAGRRRAFDAALEPVYARHGREDARALRCLPRDPGRRAPRAVRRIRGRSRRCSTSRACPPRPGTRADALSLVRVAGARDGGDPRRTARGRCRARITASASSTATKPSGAGSPARRGAPSWNGVLLLAPRRAARRQPRALPAHLGGARGAAARAHPRAMRPEVMFSVLTPGTHILPHRGVTNTRVVCHLPLVVPEDCALVVGGERHAPGARARRSRSTTPTNTRPGTAGRARASC